MKKLLLGAALLMAGSVFATSPDGYEYDLSAKNFDFKCLWIQSRQTSNFPATGAGSFEVTDASRGMAVGDGKVLIVKRTADAKTIEATASQKAIKKGFKLEVLVFDGETGTQEKSIALPDSMFCWADGDTLRQVGYPINDIHVDAAGNIILSAMTLNVYNNSPAGALMVYACKFDYTNGTVAKEKLVLNYHETYEGAAAPAAYRLDYIGVYGDLLTNGYIISAVSGTYPTVLKWNIENSVATNYFEEITIKNFVPATAVANSTGPRVIGYDENLFYHDGQDSFAGLYDMDGNYVDGFEAPEGGWATPAQDEQKNYIGNMTGGNNGVCEFAIGGRTFMVHSYRNTTGTPASSFGLIELDLSGANVFTPVVVFPNAGMGTQSNGVRTALPRVSVRYDVATIWVYQCNNGLAAYRLTDKSYVGIKNPNVSSVNIYSQNSKIVMTEEVSSVEVYSLTGQRVASAKNTAEVSAPAKGIFVVKILDKNNESKVEKVVVK